MCLVSLILWLSISLLDGDSREWERDTLLVELCIDSLVEIPCHIPIVLRRHPEPHKNINRTTIESIEKDERSRIRKDTTVALDESLDDRSCTLEVISVLDAHRPIDTAGVAHAVVDDRTTAHDPIGDEDLLIVGSDEDGMEDTYLGDCTKEILRLDDITDTYGTGDEEDKTTGKVLEIITQSHTDGETHRSKKSSERNSCKTNLGEDRHPEKDEQSDTGSAGDEGDHTFIDISVRKDLVDPLDNNVDEPASDDEDDDSQEHLDTEVEGNLAPFGQQGFCV